MRRSSPMAKPMPLVGGPPGIPARAAAPPPPAAAVWRAKTGRGDFKGGAHVVVEAADEAPVFLIEEVAELKLALYGSAVRCALVAKMVGDARKLFDVGL